MTKFISNYSKQLGFLLTCLILTALSACSPSPAATVPSAIIPTPPPASTPASGQNVAIDLVAQSISFNMSTITVPAGASVTVSFNNKDAVPHNFAVYQNLPGGQTKPIFVGNIVTGPASAVYNFAAPTASGSYFFECDVHPQSMNGTFIVTVP